MGVMSNDTSHHAKFLSFIDYFSLQICNFYYTWIECHSLWISSIFFHRKGWKNMEDKCNTGHRKSNSRHYNPRLLYVRQIRLRVRFRESYWEKEGCILNFKNELSDFVMYTWLPKFVTIRMEWLWKYII